MTTPDEVLSGTPEAAEVIASLRAARDVIFVATPLHVCQECQAVTGWLHDHRPDLSGIDDGPPERERKKPAPKTPECMSKIRAKAWATRRLRYGQYGHR